MFEPNREELAWAAGFFDGEGSSTCAKAKTAGAGRSLTFTVAQSGEHAIFLLERFRAAVGGLGKVYKGTSYGNPKHQQRWQYATSNFGDGQAALAMLWSFLGPAKRAQATKALMALKDDWATRSPLIKKRWVSRQLNRAEGRRGRRPARG